ncbi:HEAT repeat domain-containing protein [Nonomuraea sp. NPDC049695]|uniref:HEAT repeat domain-containing protein n=1 Tax=Nonomuraea sp. NPDC049695 TaxID=3154734 RepID=UPI00344AD335
MVTKPAGRHRTRRFILRQPRAAAEVAAAAQLQGWTYVREVPGGEGRMPYVVLDSGWPGISVLYFEHDAGLCGIVADSVLGPEALGTIATAVQGVLVPWMLTELLEEIDNGPDRPFALQRAGLGAPGQADPAFLARFSAAAGDAEPDVRVASMLAMADTGWPECVPVLEQAARTDGDPAMRELATKAAELLSATRPEGGAVTVDVPDLFPGGAAHLHAIAMRELAQVIGDS